MSKRALGRGIDALLSAEVEGPTSVITVPITAIKVSGEQPRKNFSNEALEELARSIESKGVLQPILVEPVGGDEYIIVAGERRFRAAKLAKLKEIPALIRSFSQLEKTEIALVENLQREDLTPVEEARGYKTLIDLGKLTQEEIARRVGKNRSTVANSLRLLKLPESMLEALDKGRISAGHARALLAVQKTSDQETLFRKIIDQELSVREVEKQAAKLQADTQVKYSGERANEIRKSPEIRSIEERFIERLGTKVNIRGSDTKGKVEISYYSMEDLERLFSLIVGEE
ncbi:MAG: ParB/RepB/Spo0J family partition protein [Spirochaetia bacterium]